MSTKQVKPGVVEKSWSEWEVKFISGSNERSLALKQHKLSSF